MSSFSDLGLSPQLLVSIEGLGYKQPTLIQEKVIPFLLSGKEDLVAKLKRPVSVHCVQQHGPFMSVMKEIELEMKYLSTN